MKRLIVVELLEIHPKATFYTIRFQEENQSEFDKLIAVCENDPKLEESLQILAYWMEKIGKSGPQERYFRPEGGSVRAIPVEASKIRAYCYRVNSRFLIWSGGGIKKTRTYEEDPQLLLQVKLAGKIGFRLQRRLETGEILPEGDQLKGDLTFEINI